MSNSPLRLTVKMPLFGPFDDGGEDVALLVEALFRHDDQPAFVLAVGMGVGDRLEAAVLAQLARRDQEVEIAELPPSCRPDRS